MKIGIAQINSHVGNIKANRDKILDHIEEARQEPDMTLIVFPELALTGYPPEDLLLRPGLARQVSEAMEFLTAHTDGIGVIIGYPDRQPEGLYNACDYLLDGRNAHTYRKQHLPNYGVFDEARYFIPGPAPGVVEIPDLSVALSICEDIWSDTSAEQLRDVDADIIININASPYHFGKLDERRDLLKRRVGETGKPIVYVNMVGGQDELVFDGGSMVMNAAGDLVLQAPQYEEGLYCLELKYEKSRLSFPPSLPCCPDLSQEQSIYQCLVLGVRDYVRKNGFHGAVIGLSGGIDSALTLCVAADALEPEQVEALLMPSCYTSHMSMEDSVTLCENLGVKYDIISIENPFNAFLEVLNPVFADLPADVTEENIQARCRGLLLMAVSNKMGKLVLATGNKSELSVGYATLYGDMAGGFAPLKDVSKSMVRQLARWRNQQDGVIPQRIIERPPSAELAPDQKDEDSLPPYDILDPVLERYIELDQSPGEIIDAGYDRETVLKIIRMVDRNEYKRRQAAPGVKISKRAFGRDRRYPITSGYREE